VTFEAGIGVAVCHEIMMKKKKKKKTTMIRLYSI
jgi:predicted nucleic acid-binding Zn ribbon protein